MAGQMGLSMDFADRMTPYEFVLYREGWKEQQHEEWRRSRAIEWAVLATMGGIKQSLEEYAPPYLKERIEAESEKPKKKALKVTMSDYDRLMSRFDTTPKE